jgi:hypothetical protein
VAQDKLERKAIHRVNGSNSCEAVTGAASSWSPWNEERTNKLIALWNAGKSTDACAEALRVSRSAIIGKLSRLRRAGVTLRPTHERVIVDGKLVDARVAHAKATLRKKQRQKGEVAPARKPRRIVPDLPKIESKPCPPKPARRDSQAPRERIDLDMVLSEDTSDLIFDVIELEPHHCRWVVGDPALGVGHFGWCKRPKVPGGRWCKVHQNVVDRAWRHGDEAAADDEVSSAEVPELEQV